MWNESLDADSWDKMIDKTLSHRDRCRPFNNISIYNCHYKFLPDLENIDHDSQRLASTEAKWEPWLQPFKQRPLCHLQLPLSWPPWLWGAWFLCSIWSINLASECWFGGLRRRWGIVPLRLMERNLIRGQGVIKKLAEKWKWLPWEVDGGLWLWALGLSSNIFVFSCASRNVLASSIC